MKIIELFSGNGDISEKMRERGHSALTVDYDPEKHSDIVMNVYDLSAEFLSQFDFIWASPDCTTYSLASHGKHRKSGCVPVSDYAKECDMNNARLVDVLLKTGKPFIIENPRAHMRNLPYMRELFRATVYYSSYGAPYSKPTDLFSNRSLYGLFNEKVLCTRVHLDYCKGPTDFLGRCRIPTKLIEDICRSMEILHERENENE